MKITVKYTHEEALQLLADTFATLNEIRPNAQDEIEVIIETPARNDTTIVAKTDQQKEIIAAYNAAYDYMSSNNMLDNPISHIKHIRNTYTTSLFAAKRAYDLYHDLHHP